MDTQNLQQLLDLLTRHSKIHICIHDLTGILQHSCMQIKAEQTIHSSELCTVAKSTPAGRRICLHCKYCANTKAVKSQKEFWGLCPYGLTEIAVPVMIESKVRCIVYVGNISINVEKTKERIRKTISHTKVMPKSIEAVMDTLEYSDNIESYKQAAHFIAGYISLICTKNDLSSSPKLHWAVEAAMNYINAYYCNDVTLKQIARLYYINEKYLGQLFKQQTGKTFSADLNEKRIAKAKDLLVSLQSSVLAVSLQCGFQNVTYFNRVFKSLIGMTPTEYRESYKVI